MKGNDGEKNRWGNVKTDLMDIRFYLVFIPIHMIVGVFRLAYNVGKKFLEKIEKMISPKTDDLKEMLKAYQDILETEIHLNSPLIQEYKQERIFLALAGMLQFISFFTTYEGSALYFGGLFSMAPYLVALVVQIGLYETSKTVFLQGNKRLEAGVIMVLLLSSSIVCSYGGIYSSYNSPKLFYEKNYEEYRKIGQEILQDVSKTLKSDAEMIEELDSVILQISANVELGEENIKQLTDKIEKIDPQATVGKTETKTTRLGNGRYVTETVTSANENANYDQEIQVQNDMETKKATLDSSVANMQKLLTEYEQESENEPSKAAKLLQQYLQDKENHVDDLNILYSNVQSLIEYNTELCNALGIPNVFDKNSISDYEDMFFKDEKQQELKSLVESETDISAGIGPLTGNGKINTIWSKIKEFLGIDIQSMPMEKLSSIKEDIMKKTEKIESLVNVFSGIDSDKKRRLEEQKKKIEEMPDAMVYAMNHLASKENAAFLCFAIAAFNDGMTVCFCFLAAKKRYSFSYVKSSKDYYMDRESLFELVFRSMHMRRIEDIKNSKCNETDIKKFRADCENFVQETSKEIREFLEKLQLSPSTVSEGFNMRMYLNDAEMDQYAPIISVLLKTNLGKILPYTDYEELECKYYLNKEFYTNNEATKDNLTREDYIELMTEEKKKGTVFLLRNRAENTLREHISNIL